MEEDTLTDVWDGSVLRTLCAPTGFFSDQYKLALSLSTDGIPLYKSSTTVAAIDIATYPLEFQWIST